MYLIHSHSLSTKCQVLVLELQTYTALVLKPTVLPRTQTLMDITVLKGTQYPPPEDPPGGLPRGKASEEETDGQGTTGTQPVRQS